MTKKIEGRLVQVWYCDVCGGECGLPYYGGCKDGTDFGYGECCATRVFREEQKQSRWDTAMAKIKGQIFFK